MTNKWWFDRHLGWMLIEPTKIDLRPGALNFVRMRRGALWFWEWL